MKCQDSDSDHAATVEVFANGILCPEYTTPSTTDTNDPKVVSCIVPVSNGDELSIKGCFQGTILHGCIDLLADGSFVGDKRIEGSKTGEVKLVKRKIDFSKVLDMPVPPDHTSIYPSTVVVEGILKVKPLQGLPTLADGQKDGVGSLAVIISVNQTSEDNYEPTYPDQTVGSWKTRDFDGATDGVTPPTHELEVIITDVHNNRQSKHRRHFAQTRFGHKPWAKFVFYYRSWAAINTAGGVPRGDKSFEFQVAGDEEKDASEKSSVNRTESEMPVSANSSNRSSGDAIFVTPPPPPPPPSVVGKKQKLLGQSLRKTSLASTGVAGNAKEDHWNPKAHESAEIARLEREMTFTSQRDDPPSTLDNSHNFAKYKHNTDIDQPGHGDPRSEQMPSATRSESDAETDGRATSVPAAQSERAASSLQSQQSVAGMAMNPYLPIQSPDAEIKHEPLSPSEANFNFHYSGGSLSDSLNASSSIEHSSIAHHASTLPLTPNTTASKFPTASPASSLGPLTSTHKRGLMAVTDSREGTPLSVKRARASSRTLELRARLQEKKKRNAEAKQALEEQKKAREEEQRKRDEQEMEENAMLERMIAEEDELFEVLEREKESEENALQMMMEEGQDQDENFAKKMVRAGEKLIQGDG